MLHNNPQQWKVVNHQLKIKPPPIIWSLFASIGASASVGSYVGFLIHSKEFTLPAITLSIIMISVGFYTPKTMTKQIMLVVAIFFVFVSSAMHQQPEPGWSVFNNNELIEIDCTVITDPEVIKHTTGLMSIFDYRNPVTRLKALATPSNHGTYVPLVIHIYIDGTQNIKKNEDITCVGWLVRSQKHPHTNSLYCSDFQSIIKDNNSPSSTTKKLKASIRNTTLRNLDKQNKTLARALFFGIRDSGWVELAKTFRMSGMSHILAISGLHITLFIIVITAMLTNQKSSPLWFFVLVFVSLITIVITTELRAPVIRAIIIVAIVSTIKIYGSRCSNVGLLGIAAFLFLIFNPRGAGTITYQLTFIVVASLCVLLPQIQWRLLGPNNPNATITRTATRWVFSLWVTGACAWCVATPITTHVFGAASFVGLISSVPAILILELTITAGIVKTLAATIITNPTPITDVFSALLGALASMASALGAIPYAYITNTTISWFESLIIIVWIATWSTCRRWRVVVWACLPILIFEISMTRDTQGVVITTIHVGHGTCHIIQHSNNTIIIDAGSRNNLDIGVNIIIPKLQSLGVSAVNTIIITHADLDHIAGIPDILETYRVEEIIISPQLQENIPRHLGKVIEYAKINKTQLFYRASGWKKTIGDLSISILFPLYQEEHRSSNAQSIVMLLNSYGRTVLFTGDIDEQRIKQLMFKTNKKVDIIELPHHGQWSEESQLFIKKQKPFAVIQSTSKQRHKKDNWIIPLETTRFVTAIDGDITTRIATDGKITISGSNNPDIMEICLF